MACVVVEESADRVWDSLLEFRRFLAGPGATAQVAGFRREADGRWRFDPEGAAESAESVGGDALRVLLGDESIPEPGRGACFSQRAFRLGLDPLPGIGAAADPGALGVYRLYLPLLVGALEARARGRSFVTGHLAQSLDGRIACRNGHSQWISNQANLHHAHRLRALHDAVLVGAGTVASDDPRLTVRHVRGDSPRRVVLSARGSVFEAEGQHVFEGDGATVLCRPEVAERGGGRDDGARIHALGGGRDSELPPALALAELAGLGQHTVFLEGGAGAISSFLQAGAIDVLHVHVAPLILGSGIPSFQLPDVDHVDEGRRLRVAHFEMDGELLVECRAATPVP